LTKTRLPDTKKISNKVGLLAFDYLTEILTAVRQFRQPKIARRQLFHKPPFDEHDETLTGACRIEVEAKVGVISMNPSGSW